MPVLVITNNINDNVNKSNLQRDTISFAFLPSQKMLTTNKRNILYIRKTIELLVLLVSNKIIFNDSINE